MIVLYSTGCPKCRVLEKKLSNLGRDFKIVDNQDEVLKFGQDHNMNSAPILVTENNDILDFVSANRYLSTL